MELKTSKDWKQELYPTTTILDPDGWDRTNLDYSFDQELISKEEFMIRFCKSTVYN